MREKIVGLLEKIDFATAESEDVLDPGKLQPIAELGRQIRDRLAYPDDVLIVGLVGGTGSGKSSLVNAMAGREVAETGSIRPTTAQPMALAPSGRLEDVAGFLNEMGIVIQVAGEHDSRICLIDLPDIDSVEGSHLETVVRLLPRLDVVGWVVDPEKYRDANVHTPIATFATSQSRFVFILNQVDRLPPGDVEMVADDFIAALSDDGIANPSVFLTAAAPLSGPPIGIDEMVAGILGRSEGALGVYGKLVDDAMSAAAGLSALAGGASGLDFENRWAAVIEDASAHLSRDQRADAAHAVSRLMSELADECGDLTESELRRLSGLVHGVVEEAEDEDATLRALDELIASPARKALGKRARCHAAIADLVIAASDSGSR